MTIAENMAAGRAFVPATLRLTQRRSILDGQTVRYVVPVLDFNLLAERGAALPDGSRAGALPAGYKPLPELTTGPTLGEGLKIAATQEVKVRPRGQTPIPAADDDIPFGDGPVAVEVEAPAAPTVPFITQAQRKRLFALAKGSDLDEDALREFIRTYTGQDSTSAITKDQYEPLCAAIQAQVTP
jgi:hypothetical protein